MKITSNDILQSGYEGDGLESQTTYYWKVRVREKRGHENPWSQTTSFHTAYLVGDAMAGQWIMSADKTMRSPLMRKAWDPVPTSFGPEDQAYSMSWLCNEVIKKLNPQ